MNKTNSKPVREDMITNLVSLANIFQSVKESHYIVSIQHNN